MSSDILQITRKTIEDVGYPDHHARCSICLQELDPAIDASSYEDLYAYHIHVNSQNQSIHQSAHFYCFYEHNCRQILKLKQRQITCPLDREVIQGIDVDSASVNTAMTNTITALFQAITPKGFIFQSSQSTIAPIEHPELDEKFIYWVRQNYPSHETDVLEKLPKQILESLPYTDFWDQFSKDSLIQIVSKIPAILAKFPKELCDDEGLAFSAVQRGNVRYFPVSDRLKNDKNFMLKVLKKNGSFLAFASDALKDDTDFILEAVDIFAEALRYASDRLKDDKNIVLQAVTINGLMLEEASPRLRNDLAVVLAAAQNNPDALAYMGPLLIDDKDLFLKLLPVAPKALQYSSTALCDDKELVLKYIQANAENFHYASDRLKDDKEVLLAALERDPASYWEASFRLRKDPEINRKFREFSLKS